jgi:hypothetical protein
MENLFLLLFLTSFVALSIGLVKPSSVKQDSRKKVSLVFGGATVVFFIIGASLAPKSSETPVVTTGNTESTAQEVASTSSTEIERAVTPAPIVEKKTTGLPVVAPTKTETTSITTPTLTPQADNQNTSPVSNETVSQTNATKKAKSYLDYTAFSHDGLVDQLEYDQFSHADAVYGTDSSGANWNEQAAKKAKSYMEYSAFSRGSLIAQLEYDKFTQAQAEYGANAVGL